MRLWADCIPCLWKMALGAARTALDDEAQVRAFFGRVSKLAALRGEEWNATAPEVAMAVWQELVEAAGNDDPLRAVKDKQNRAALVLYPKAQEAVAKAADGFLQALKLAVAGNSIDTMVGVKDAPTDALLEHLGNLPIDPKAVTAFRSRLEKAKRVVYATDNCGEIVFDRLFLEVVKETFSAGITVVTRSLPALNDATLRDAEEVGLAVAATTVANGIAVPLPGTFLRWVAPEVRTLFDQADLVVSKGVGNYDSLTEEAGLAGKITYLFHGKCIPCCNATHASLGDLVVLNR